MKNRAIMHDHYQFPRQAKTRVGPMCSKTTRLFEDGSSRESISFDSIKHVQEMRILSFTRQLSGIEDSYFLYINCWPAAVSCNGKERQGRLVFGFKDNDLQRQPTKTEIHRGRYASGQPTIETENSLLLT